MKFNLVISNVLHSIFFVSRYFIMIPFKNRLGGGCFRGMGVFLQEARICISNLELISIVFKEWDL